MKKNIKINKLITKNRSKFFVCLLLIFFVFGTFFKIYLNNQQGEFQQPLENDKIIMHAMGGIDGNDYTNSLEAFENHYGRGRRVFEVDFALTSDEKIVAKHSKKIEISQEEFLSQKIMDRYTPLSLEMVLDLMLAHEDMILITDMKSDYSNIISKIVELARSKDETLLGRIIPQVYSKETYKQTMDLYDFEKVIYTLYIEKPKDKEVVDFLGSTKNIYAITMSESRFSSRSAEKMNSLGVPVFVHTLNNEKEINNYLKKGASGIYTDEY